MLNSSKVGHLSEAFCSLEVSLVPVTVDAVSMSVDSRGGVWRVPRSNHAAITRALQRPLLSLNGNEQQNQGSQAQPRDDVHAVPRDPVA